MKRPHLPTAIRSRIDLDGERIHSSAVLVSIGARPLYLVTVRAEAQGIGAEAWIAPENVMAVIQKTEAALMVKWSRGA